MAEFLRLDRPLSVRELLLAWLGLLVVGGLAFYPLIHHGGFHLDDWSNGAGALYPPGGDGLGDVFDFYKGIALFRPVLIVYVPLTYFVFGMNMWLHLAWSVFLGVTVAALLYAVLRTLRVPWVHALLISGLVLLFPWFDGIRYWVTGAQVSLTVAIMLGGLWVALTGLKRDSWSWHVVAASLYLLSILTYEVTLPVIAGLGLIYILYADWQRARWRWALDWVAVLAGGIWVASHTVRTSSGLAGNISHLEEIVRGGGTIIGRGAWPVGSEHTTLALLAIACLLIAGLIVQYRSPTEEDRGWGLRQWLVLGGAGLAIIGLGWVIFIPADPYYTPVIYGLTNRVNGMAGIGVVILVYASLGVLGALVGRLRRGMPLTPIIVTAVLALLLGFGYSTVLRRHTGIWNSAFISEEMALKKIQSRYPDLPPGTTLFAGGWPAYQTLGVPILSATWDLDGMVKTRYEDGTLSAYPLLPTFALGCGKRSINLESEGTLIRSAPYGTARLINLATDATATPRDKRQCTASIGAYSPGPFYLSYDY